MDETTTGSSTTTTTRSSTETTATPIPQRSAGPSNTTSRLETRPARSSTDLVSTEMGTSGATSRSAPPDSSEASWAILFFFNDTAPTEIYTLSLHDALLL